MSSSPSIEESHQAWLIYIMVIRELVALPGERLRFRILILSRIFTTSIEYGDIFEYHLVRREEYIWETAWTAKNIGYVALRNRIIEMYPWAIFHINIINNKYSHVTLARIQVGKMLGNCWESESDLFIFMILQDNTLPYPYQFKCLIIMNNIENEAQCPLCWWYQRIMSDSSYT